MPAPTSHPDGAYLRQVADAMTDALPGKGFALFVFEFNKPHLAHYISNAQRETMLQALRETYHRLSSGQDIATPENN